MRTSDGLRWTFPKGHVEQGESLIEAVGREAFEEGGVAGSVSDEPLRVYRYPSAGEKGGETVSAYLLNVKKQTRPVEEGRDPQWVDLNGAKSRFGENREEEWTDEHIAVLESAVQRLAQLEPERSRLFNLVRR